MYVRARLCVASWFPTGFDICPRPDPSSASLARGAARDTSSPGPPPPIVGTPLPESRWLPVLPTGSTRPVQHLLAWIPFTLELLCGLHGKPYATTIFLRFSPRRRIFRKDLSWTNRSMTKRKKEMKEKEICK